MNPTNPSGKSSFTVFKRSDFLSVFENPTVWGMHANPLAFFVVVFLNFILLPCSIQANSSHSSYTAELHKLLSQQFSHSHSDFKYTFVKDLNLCVVYVRCRWRFRCGPLELLRLSACCKSEILGSIEYERGVRRGTDFKTISAVWNMEIRPGDF